MKKTKTNITLKNIELMKSYIFLIPLILGLVFFFLIPITKSFLFSISEVKSEIGGYSFLIKGFGEYKNALFSHTSYRQMVVKSVINMAAITPLIILFSFFIASVLNQNFHGKTFFRVVFFLPVILSIMSAFSGDSDSLSEIYQGSDDILKTSASFTQDIAKLMINSGISSNIVDSFTGLVDKIYSIINLSSIQILIMLIGMQSISLSLYEAATVEGATKWESFWKITFPMISPLILTCTVYTIIDTFTRNDNSVMALMSETAFQKLNLSLASAMGWLYFLIIGVFLLIVMGIFKKFILIYDI